MNLQDATSMKPTVAIVGRPNVGKSTLFNRLTGRRQSIVSDIAGTTRDRVIAETEWSEQPFVLVDTGGLDLFPDDAIWKQVSDQIHFAINQCDVITLLVDVSEGITAADRDVADLIRKTGKPTVLAASKSDNDQRRILAVELYELGLGDPIPISAYHNIGLDELMEQILKHFPSQQTYLAPEADLNLAIVGRTNVGKSMLLNSITGENRAIVSEISGTTRDSVDTTIVYQDREIQLIDTAGIRRRGSIEQGIERYSVLRSMRAIERCQVAALVLDASEFATSQDTHIASYILETYRGIVIVVNKWDLRREMGLDKQTMEARIRGKFKFASYAPIVFTSALNTDGINELLDTALRVQVEWSKGIPRPDIRRTVLSAVAENPPPSG
ncbi:MAG: ribosome biogenesis GTPase Der, partial [Chloroflexota bacterium]|nr:ribosome biogenesis GTPase Der [Chloroflexota bacterium]